MANIISSYPAFIGQVGEPSGNQQRLDALKTYFEKGGVISFKRTETGWPKLIYPSPLKIRGRIEELEKLRATFAGKVRHWDGEVKKAKGYHAKNQLLKLKEPLYWKHTAKLLSDSDYRKDAESISLPAHLVADDRWKPMIRMFVNDIEYRKQLTETVRTSVVYKNDRKVARYANELQQFRMDRANNEIGVIQKKIDALDGEIAVLNKILAWAQE